MKKPNVYLTRLIPEPAVEFLRDHCEVVINTEDRSLTKEELCKNVKGKDAVICMLNDVIDADVINSAAGVKIFANYAVGFNNLDLEAATKNGILVSNTPDVLTDATADIAWALLFSTARRVVESDKYTREGKFKGWGSMLFLGRDISGKTLGIIGAGRIGRNFARKAMGFNMKILYNSRTPKPDFEKETGAIFVDRDTLLKESDFISLHVPLLPETRYMLGEKEFKLMKNTAILINTSRGPVVDEKALVKALREGMIWGAGLDVYEREPLLEAGLAELDNVVVTPHIASGTVETRTKMGFMAAQNVMAALEGKLPPNCINPEALKK